MTQDITQNIEKVFVICISFTESLANYLDTIKWLNWRLKSDDRTCRSIYMGDMLNNTIQDIIYSYFKKIDPKEFTERDATVEHYNRIDKVLIDIKDEIYVLTDNDNKLNLSEFKDIVDKYYLKLILKHDKLIKVTENFIHKEPKESKEKYKFDINITKESVRKITYELLNRTKTYLALTSPFIIAYYLVQLKSMIEYQSIDHEDYFHFNNKLFDIVDTLDAFSGFRNFGNLFVSEVTVDYFHNCLPRVLIDLILSYDVVHNEQVAIDRIKFVKNNNKSFEHYPYSNMRKLLIM